MEVIIITDFNVSVSIIASGFWCFMGKIIISCSQFVG